MTLVIAGTEENFLWMVADTAVSDPSASVRKRSYEMKIRPIGRGLVAFAGTIDTAKLVVASLSKTDSVDVILEKLRSCCRQNENIEFAYGIVDEEGAKLYKVTDVSCTRLPLLFLGDHTEYGRFRLIKSQPILPARMNSFHSLSTKISSKEKDVPPPKALHETIQTLLSLFSGTDERGVGGWAVPFWADREGSHLLAYEYRVSDLLPEYPRSGDLIPRPSLEGGGAVLNFFPGLDGKSAVAQWLPSNLAIAFIETEGNYETIYSTEEPGRLLSLLQRGVSLGDILAINKKWSERKLGKKSIKDASGKVVGYLVSREEGDEIELTQLDGLPFQGSAFES